MASPYACPGRSPYPAGTRSEARAPSHARAFPLAGPSDPEIAGVRYSRAAYRLAFEFSGTAGTIDLPEENPQLRTSRQHCHGVLEGESTGAERDSP